MKEKLASLIEVKKLIALVLTLVFCLLAFRNEINTSFMAIYTMIVGFYFGQSTAKNTK
jgi:4-hydroxybenzoate polyprenyltransferase